MSQHPPLCTTLNFNALGIGKSTAQRPPAWSRIEHNASAFTERSTADSASSMGLWTITTVLWPPRDGSSGK
jgi:hypothetical protein